MSTPTYPAYPTYQISSSALHLITGRLDDDPVPAPIHRHIPMTRFSVKSTVVAPPVKEEAPACRQG